MDRPPKRLALIEVAERDARSPRLVDVHAWPVGIGRAIDNEVVVDDPYVAAAHARLDRDDQGRLTLTVLDDVNGMAHGGERLPTGVAWPVVSGGATVQLGTTRLRIRLPDETLAPPQAMAGGVAIRPATLALCAAALLALQVGQQWLALDPGADLATWLPFLLGVPVGVAAWCGAWALMSKVFQHRFDFGGHLGIAVPWLLVLGLVEGLWPQVAASLGQPWLWQLGAPLQGLLAVLLVRAHLLHLLPQHPRAVTGALGALALAGAGVSAALTLRSSDSLSSAAYMSTLPLPALRLAGTVPVRQAVEAVGPLADKLARRVAKAHSDDDEEGADAGTE
jgi:hypothetical protein